MLLLNSLVTNYSRATHAESFFLVTRLTQTRPIDIETDSNDAKFHERNIKTSYDMHRDNIQRETYGMLVCSDMRFKD